MGQAVTLYDFNGNEISYTHPLSVRLNNEDTDIQYPLATDGDSVYIKDIWVDESSADDWIDESSTGLDVVLVPFSNLHTIISNSTTDNPKVIIFHMNRSLHLNQVGIGCVSDTDTFSNVKITLLGSGGVARSVLDDSDNDTKYKSNDYKFGPELCNAVKIEFYTEDKISISNITIQKVSKVAARMEALKPDGTVVSIDATNGGNLKISLEEVESGISTNNNSQIKVTNFTELGDEGVCITDCQTGINAKVVSLGALKIADVVRLVGTTFSGTTKDTNFWYETVTGTGTVVQNGQIILSTGTTADSTVRYTSVRKARLLQGASNQFRVYLRQKEEVSADCIRRCGVYNDDSGFFIQYDGTTFGFGRRCDGIDYIIENGNFNGNAGTTIEADETTYNLCAIEYTTVDARLFINGTLIHSISSRLTDTNLICEYDLPVNLEIINENGNIIDNGCEIIYASIIRFGRINSESISKFINTNTTTVCKYGSGRLHTIVNVDNAGSVAIYDNVTATGILIAEIDTAKALGTLSFNLPFNNGLTIVSSLGAKIVVIYE